VQYVVFVLQLTSSILAINKWLKALYGVASDCQLVKAKHWSGKDHGIKGSWQHMSPYSQNKTPTLALTLVMKYSSFATKASIQRHRSSKHNCLVSIVCTTISFYLHSLIVQK